MLLDRRPRRLLRNFGPVLENVFDYAGVDTIVYRDEVPHNFPKPHTDVLELFVDYRVPSSGHLLPESPHGRPDRVLHFAFRHHSLLLSVGAARLPLLPWVGKMGPMMKEAISPQNE